MPLSDDDDGGEVLSCDKYSESSRQIGAYLVSGFQRPTGMPATELKKFKNKVMKYVLKGNHLFRRPDKIYLVLRRVIDNEEAR